VSHRGYRGSTFLRNKSRTLHGVKPKRRHSFGQLEHLKVYISFTLLFEMCLKLCLFYNSVEEFEKDNEMDISPVKTEGGCNDTCCRL
jgi:hypothetical protein